MSSRKRVLIVDDHSVNRTVATLHLRGSDWDSAQAVDGFDALDQLSKEAFDCVLLDMSMPGMSGQEVCQKIRADERLHALPVVAYTAHALESEVQQIRESGFDDVLLKPIKRANLLEALNAATSTD